MQVVSSYGVHIRDSYEALKRTADLFSHAVACLVQTALANWNSLSDTDGSHFESSRRKLGTLKSRYSEYRLNCIL